MCGLEEIVLTAIMRSGAKVMFGCRGGGCGTCKMRLISGRVNYGRCSAAVLPEAEKREGAFLSCQARPLSDLTVELTEANRYRKTLCRFAEMAGEFRGSLWSTSHDCWRLGMNSS